MAHQRMRRATTSRRIHATWRAIPGGTQHVCGVQARHLGAAFPLAIPPVAREPRVILRQYYAVFMLVRAARREMGSNLLSRLSGRRGLALRRKEVTSCER